MESSIGGVIAFALVGVMLLIGNILRSKISFLKNNLVPSSLIGGAVGFILLSLDLIPGYVSKDFKLIALHSYTFIFIVLLLMGSESKNNNFKFIVRGGLILSCIWSIAFLLQAFFGFSVVALYNAVFGTEVPKYLGQLVNHGFAQGTGLAMAVGGVWEKNYNIEGAVQMGIIYASVGYAMAYIIGIPLAKKYITEGRTVVKNAKLSGDILDGFYTSEEKPIAARQMTHPAAIDSLAYHLALIGISYIMAYLFIENIAPYVAGNKYTKIFFGWSLFFVWGLVMSAILRWILTKIDVVKTMDNNTLRTLANAAVDIMIVSSIMSVSAATVSQYGGVILVVVITATLLTLYLATRLVKNSGEGESERTLAIFGALTGSTGSGLLLLRIADPEFKTTISREMGVKNMVIVPMTIAFFFMLMSSPSLEVTTVLGSLLAYALILIFVVLPLLKRWKV